MVPFTVLIISTFCQSAFGVPKYVFHDVPISSLVADDTCQATYGTHLASIHSDTDNTEAQTLCHPQTTDVRPACWIGLHDFHSEAGTNNNGFIWYDETPLIYSNWRPGEPNEYYKAHGGEDLVSIVAESGLWNDELNTRQLRLICWNPEYTHDPTHAPTESPTTDPTATPTVAPTSVPTEYPTDSPTQSPTNDPTNAPTESPTTDPTATPTVTPTSVPTEYPTYSPTQSPTNDPTNPPTVAPTLSPTLPPTLNPTKAPTANPTTATDIPTLAPTWRPTMDMEVKEETTDIILVTPHGAAPKTHDATDAHPATFVVRNSTTIVYVLAVLIFCTCVVVIILFYSEWRKRQGDKKNDGLRQPLLIPSEDYPALPENRSTELSGEGDEGVELATHSVRWIDHRLSSIVENTASIESSDENGDSGDSEVLYTMQDDKTRKEDTMTDTGDRIAMEGDDDRDSSGDSLYEYHDPTPTMGAPNDNTHCEHVLETPMGDGEDSNKRTKK